MKKVKEKKSKKLHDNKLLVVGSINEYSLAFLSKTGTVYF
jgi:hypothetical protein